MTQLDSLKMLSIIVADTANYQLLNQFESTDTTTNPTLIMQVSRLKEFQPYVEEAMIWARKQGGEKKKILQNACLYLTVGIGAESLKKVPGCVSTEVDARLSFNTPEMIQQARTISLLYEKKGISRERVLIKIASTWEGIQAGKLLEKEGIQCNMTLIFEAAQAIACAEAGITLISPFVGRISDWYKKQFPSIDYQAEKDPGVTALKGIYYYLKYFNYPTIVMGASFRSIDQICAVAGCDKLTISPALLTELKESMAAVSHALSPIDKAADNHIIIEKVDMNEHFFRWEMNSNELAHYLLADGIRKFAEDQKKLEESFAQY